MSKTSKTSKGNRTLTEDQNRVVEELSLLRTEYSRNRLTQEERFNRFQQISKNLSSFLPPLSDNSLLEIDHLISTDDNTAGTNMHSKVGRLLQNKCFPLFIYIYYKTMFECTLVMDTTFLQLIEHVSKKPFEEHCLNDQSIVELVNKLITKRNELLLIRAVKILKVSVDNHKDVILGEFKRRSQYDNFAFYWLSKLSDIPEARYTYEQPITSWLSEQSDSINKIIRFKDFHFNYIPLRNYFNKKEIKRRNNSQKICALMSCLMKNPLTDMTFYFDDFFDYFTSSPTEIHWEINKRMADFLRGVYMAHYRRTYGDSVVSFSNLTHHQCAEIGLYTRFIVNHFMFHLAEIVIRYLPNTHLRQLEDYCTYDTSKIVLKNERWLSYLDFKDKTNELMKKYFKNSKKSENFNGSTEKFLFECKKFCFFDDFMKSLQVIDIIHYDWLLIEDHFESKCLDEGILTEVFRPYLSPIKSYINTLLSNPSKRGRVNWWIQVILRKCPFLIISQHHGSHIENLIRMLKGKKIKKATEDELYFIINNKAYEKRWDEQLYPYERQSFDNERNDFTDDDTDDENDNFDDDDSDIETSQ